ncbi:metallophosphoesterase family protein [Candidatus Woesearchaeota archaeon]|nr:metallophosphoesterase family protein [Candidatus Woesearchaeota archaeon]
MKILAFTDTHGAALGHIRRKAQAADIIVCAGDFTFFGKKTKTILASMNRLGKKVLLIHGNHEDEKEVRKACEGNVEFIHRKALQLGGFWFAGYGGGGFALRDAGLERFMRNLEGKKNLIIVTHAPPFGTRLDLLWEYRGNRSITGAIRSLRPLLAISGHFHEHFGERDKIGGTVLLNPGPKGVIVQV